MAFDHLPLKVRKQVWARSDHGCELGCGRPANHIHHRKLRSQGRRHELPNLLHLCTPCHIHAHANPELGYANGWLVHSWENPADVAVVAA
jgi:hypothetical protein